MDYCRAAQSLDLTVDPRVPDDIEFWIESPDLYDTEIVELWKRLACKGVVKVAYEEDVALFLRQAEQQKLTAAVNGLEVSWESI
ncbi:hypothetical protein LTR85_000697 [Meristemomyces frigidus]|nr:hypothetical protein LTR85_000697 [Meristemomyces frigidus]